MARAAFIFVAVGDDGIKGHIGTSFLKPGQEVLVSTTMPAPDKVHGIDGFVQCLDYKNVKHAWSVAGKHRAYRRRLSRRRYYSNDYVVFEQLCGRSAQEIRLDRYVMKLDKVG